MANNQSQPKNRFESKAQEKKYWEEYTKYLAGVYGDAPLKKSKSVVAVPRQTPTPTTTSAINPYQRLQELYSIQSRGAKNIFDGALSQYDADKNAQQAKIDNASNTAHQQAYISYMLQKKEMPQLLAAMGISGGGAESTISSMQNTYGQNRNNIDIKRNESVSELEAQYTKLKSEAKRKFDQQMNEYDLQYQKSSARL